MSWEAYFENERQRLKKRQQQIDERKEEAWHVARQLSRVLYSEFHVNRVIVIGSLCNNRFSMDSDIDLAVEGLNPEWYFKAAATIDHSNHPFSVDLIDLDRSNPYMKAMAKRGKILYECSTG